MDEISSSADASVAPNIAPEHLESDLNTLVKREKEHNLVYKKEIWNCLLQRDAEKPKFQMLSPQLMYRGSLVQKLRDVAKKLDLGISTLHSAVALLDLFMDSYSLRSDRLRHVALACLSLAAKVEEDFVTAPSLKTLSIASETALCGKSFRQIEWMIGQHVEWKLLVPTPVSYAALLAELVICDTDYVVENDRKLEKKLKLEGAQRIDAYLDLTLSDVRLKAVEPVLVGCACVSCARNDMELSPWTFQLKRATQRRFSEFAPITRRLHKMMKILRANHKHADDPDFVDQGYNSARTTPTLTPNTSPSNEFRHITTNFFTNYLDKVKQAKTVQEDLSNTQTENFPNLDFVRAPLTPAPEPSTSTSGFMKRNYDSDSSDSSYLTSVYDSDVDSLPSASDDEDENYVTINVKKARLCDWQPQTPD